MRLRFTVSATYAILIFVLLSLTCFAQAQSDKGIAQAVAAARAFQQAEALHKQGKLREAIEQYKTVLQLRQPLNDKRSDVLMLDLIAALHNQLGEKPQALAAFQQVLTLRTGTKNQRDEAATLHNIGVLFGEMGDKRQALLHFERALHLWRQTNEQSGLAATLNAVGALYAWAGQKEMALQYYEAALPLKHATGDRSGEAYTRNNIGALWSALGEKRKARESFLAALSLWRAIADRKGQALALTNLGVIFTELGERQKALDYFQQSLALRQEVLDRNGEARTLGNLGFVYALLGDKSPALEHLNQSLALARTTNSLDDEAATLHHLMLVWKQFNQANQAIAFGKLTVNAYQQFRANLQDTPLQQSFVKTKADAYRALAELLIDAGRLLEAQQVLRLLKAEEYFEFVRGDEPNTNTARLALTPEELEITKGYLQRAEITPERKNLLVDLTTLAPDTAAIFTVVGEDKYRVMLFTADTHIAREYPIKAADLNRKVQAFRESLNAQRPDFMPLARELYRILLAPISPDLARVNIQTLLWSLDGALRYVPIAALHDGEKYFIERYPSAVLTLSSRLQKSPCEHWRGLGLGMSKASPGFPSLVNVPNELSSIVREQPNGKGLLEGRILLNEAFTEMAMKTELQKHYPVVHIASHFKLEPGNETDSYLLLGDGSPLTLAQLKQWRRAFADVEILTLSACETGVGDGREIESFGELAQRQGAKAVVATLLQVPDQSTALLMQQFYRNRATMPKAEALRQAQLELLRRSQFKHPAYWSPFVLMGNFQ